MKELEIEKEITDLLVKTLQDHKEQYILGSWESFVKYRQRRKRLLFFFTSTGIAATFLAGLIGLRLFLTDGKEAILENTNQTEITIAKVKPTVENLKETFSSPNALPEEHKAKKIAEKVPVTEGVVNFSANKVPKQDEIIAPVAEISFLKGQSFQIDYHAFQTANLIRQSSFRQNDHDVLSEQGTYTVIANDDEDKPDRTRSHKLKFGVGISPGITTTASASSFNYSGGFIAEIDLTRNISLSAGIQIEHQNVVNRDTDNPSWLPEGESKAMLTALDLPINLKWELIDGKSSSYYIAGGVSSIAWLGEKYVNTNYSQKVVMNISNSSGEAYVSYDIENVKNTEIKSIDPLSSFNFAGRVNLMIGYEKKMSYKLSLHLEPFVKIPVSEKTTEVLKYAISGISCRLSF